MKWKERGSLTKVSDIRESGGGCLLSSSFGCIVESIGERERKGKKGSMSEDSKARRKRKIERKRVVANLCCGASSARISLKK